MPHFVECWQLSQPPHLRHLALVRDTALTGTITHYIHYSLNNFRRLVGSGQATWEAVEYVSKGGKSNKAQASRIPPVDAAPELDAYGLPKNVPTKDLIRNGNVALLECISSCKPADYAYSYMDIGAVKRSDGSYSKHRTAHFAYCTNKLAVHHGHYRKYPPPLARNDKPPKRSPSTTPVNERRERQIPERESQAPVDENQPDLSHLSMPQRRQLHWKTLTEKEKLEAIGMDETWTEYKVLVMERPDPGLYVTPLGRRRAVGKSRGRPPRSRVAVFKSSRLGEFPWFVRQDDGEDEGTRMPVSKQVRLPHVLPGPRRQGKRVCAESESSPVPGPSGDDARPRKQQRVDVDITSEGVDQAQNVEDLPDGEPGDGSVDPVGQNKRKRSTSDHTVEPEATGVPAAHPGDGEEPMAKRRRESQISNGVPPKADPDAPNQLISPSATNRSTEPITIHEDASDVGTHEASDRMSQTPQKRKYKTSKGKSGSIHLLRRRIIMEIVEKAGGAFPLGTELWYPFVTAWMRLQHQGTPDMRTIKTAAKRTIDAGHLQQMTFSGRDSKGTMTTKRIMIKPNLDRNSPLVKELQTALLAAGTHMHIPPNTDIHPTISMRKGPRERRRQPRQRRHPIEKEMKVQLQTKPMFVVREEMLEDRRIQKQHMRSLEAGAAPGNREQGVVRLMRLKPRSSGSPSAGATSISRPKPLEGGKHVQRRIAGFLRRAGKPISSIPPYNMLLSPEQTFHPTTGTFSTDGGFAAVHQKRAARKQTAGLPRSVSHLAGRDRQKKDVPEYDSIEERFLYENDELLRWELENEGVPPEICPDDGFINHTIQDPFNAVTIEGNVRFYKNKGRPPASTPMTTRAKTRPIQLERPPGARPLLPTPPSDQPLDFGTPTAQAEQAWQQPIAKRRQPATTPPSRRLTKLNESVNADELASMPLPEVTHRAAVPRFRGTLSQSLIQRILLAIAAVRTLAGGYEGKIIDWDLVGRCFPEENATFILERSRSLLAKQRLHVTKMQSDFQERFVEAYANGQVPPIDYGNLAAYDWVKVVDWAQNNLDTPISDKQTDLPATREQFDSLFALREQGRERSDDLWQANSMISAPRKRAMQAGIPFAMSLPDSKPRNTIPTHLDVAKTWVRANVTTPEETYNSADAWKALRRFPDPLLESAVQSLVTERVIGVGNRGRVTPGRNYDVSDHLLQTLGRRRAIDHTILRRAARFKTKILDPEFQTKGSFDVNYHAEDGDILALLNLSAAGQVILRPRDPPHAKHGLLEGMYTSRYIDKDKLRFPVEVQPVPGVYVYGNPLHDRVENASPPGCPHADTPSNFLPDRVPIWFDINGKFNKLLWDQVVAAVVGCIATRSGVSVGTITDMLKPSLGMWEVQMLLEWMGTAGVAGRDHGAGTRWSVQEWWWMVLE